MLAVENVKRWRQDVEIRIELRENFAVAMEIMA